MARKGKKNKFDISEPQIIAAIQADESQLNALGDFRDSEYARLKNIKNNIKNSRVSKALGTGYDTVIGDPLDIAGEKINEKLKIAKEKAAELKSQAEESNIGKKATKVGKTTAKVYNSTAGKSVRKGAGVAWKLGIKNKLLWRSMSLARSGAIIGVGIASVAGVGGVATVVAPQIAIPVATLSAAAVGVGVAIDTYKVRKVRRLYHENKHLNRFHQSRDRQEDIIRENPKLRTILDDELSYFETTGKKSKRRQHKSKIEKASLGKSFMSTIAQSAASYTALAAKTVVYFSPIRTAINGVTRPILFVFKFNSVHSRSKLIEALQTDIKELNQDGDAVGYDSLTDLRKKSRTQKIQTLALEKLTSQEDFPNYSPEQQKAEFQKIKKEIEKKEKAVINSFAPIELLKDMGRAHNPFSQYTSSGTIKRKMNTNIKRNADLKISYNKKDSASRNLKATHAKTKKTMKKIKSSFPTRTPSNVSKSKSVINR